MIKQAIEAMDKATPGPWIVECNEIIQERGDIASDQRDIAYLNPEAGDVDDFASSAAVEGNGIILAAAPSMAAWIKKALPYIEDQLGIVKTVLRGQDIAEFRKSTDELNQEFSREYDELTALIQEATK